MSLPQSPTDKVITDALALAYKEAGLPKLDVEAVSLHAPLVTPLDALLTAFPITSAEIAGLCTRSAAAYLQRLAPAFSLALPLAKTDTEPLAGFLFAAKVKGEAWGCILVERDHIVERRRFSAAHELGHFLLHFCGNIFIEGLEAEEQGTAQETMPTARILLTDERPSVGLSRERMEREANQFAAALLMPETLVRRLCETGGGTLASAKHLATKFLVSPAAMRVRLQSLGLLLAPQTEVLT